MHKIIVVIFFASGLWCSIVFAHQQLLSGGWMAVIWQSLSIGYAVIGVMGLILFFAKKKSVKVSCAQS